MISNLSFLIGMVFGMIVTVLLCCFVYILREREKHKDEDDATLLEIEELSEIEEEEYEE